MDVEEVDSANARRAKNDAMPWPPVDKSCPECGFWPHQGSHSSTCSQFVPRMHLVRGERPGVGCGMTEAADDPRADHPGVQPVAPLHAFADACDEVEAGVVPTAGLFRAYVRHLRRYGLQDVADKVELEQLEGLWGRG